jgi:hypothetical protein
MSNDSKTNLGLINLELPKSMDNALQNITDAPTKTIGTTISDILYLVFGGISHAADKKKLKYEHDLEEFRDQLENKINTIPAENRIEPNLRLAAQALENSKYCLEEPELREMFATLIAHTCDSRMNLRLHPAFAEILKQLSPIDAMLVSSFRQKTGTKLFATSKKYINGKLVSESKELDVEALDPAYYTYPESLLPIAKFWLSTSNSVQLIMENIVLSDISNEFQLLSASMTNLQRFGLIDLSYTETLSKYDYDQFKDCTLYKDWKDFVSNSGAAIRFIRGNMFLCGQNQEIVINPGVARLTQLGFDFLSCCAIDSEVVRS